MGWWRRTNSSPISSSSSSKFDGISYYHIVGYAGTSVGNTQTADTTLEDDGNAPGKVLGKSETNDQGVTDSVRNTNGGTVTNYELKLDAEGTPYIEVVVKGTGFYNKGGNNAAGTWDNDNAYPYLSFTQTGITTDLKGVAGYVNGANASAITDNKISSMTFNKYSVYTDASGNVGTAITASNAATFDKTSTTEASSGNGSGMVWGLQISTTSSTYNGDKAYDAVGSATEPAFDRWWAQTYHISTAVTEETLILTGNLSVQLSSGLVAVLPVSGGAIHFVLY